MHKLCIWMNYPSHYQRVFFSALNQRDDIDLKVVYLRPAPADRVAEGWGGSEEYTAYEQVAGADPSATLEGIAGWQERIHIVSGLVPASVVDALCRHRVMWCHWSEMPGLRLAELLHFNVPLYRFWEPLMLLSKRGDGKRIRDHALGAFGQGTLAQRAFIRMGVPEDRIAHLFYSPAALIPMEPCKQIRTFAGGRKVFLAVGALCRRKGIDVLLKAFARLGTEAWCVVLCGLDRSAGKYEALAERLGIRNQVLFAGAHPVDRMAEVYGAADVFVLPSRFDGWGAVLNEAASLGLPLIGSDLCGASWHIVEPGRNGYCVRAGSVRSLHLALYSYVSNPALCLVHGEESRRHFDHFSPRSNVHRLVNGIHTMMSVHGKDPLAPNSG